MTCFFVVCFVGMGSLSIELAQLYVVKIQNQRAADIAALGTALEMTGSNSASAQAIGNNLALLNESTGTASVSTSGQTVTATVAATVPVRLAGMFGIHSAPVSSTAVATYVPQSGGCAFATNPSGTGVSISGGTHLNAPTCTVTSNANVSVTGGSNLTVQTVSATGSISSSGGSSVNATNQLQNQPQQSDFVASNATVASELTALNGVSSTTAPSTSIPARPTCSGGISVTATASSPAQPTNECIINLTVGYGDSITLNGANITGSILLNYGATLILNDGTYYLPTLSIPNGANVSMGSGNYYFYGAFTDNNNASTLDFFNDGNTGNYYFSNSLTIAASVSAVFGFGNYTVAGGLVAQGSSTLCFEVTTTTGTCSAAPSSGTSTVKVNGGISLNSSSTDVLGPATYNVGGEVYLDGRISIGAGNWTDYNPGNSGLDVGGGGNITFGNGTYTIDGNVDFAGGATVAFNNEIWLINGTLTFEGGSTSTSATGTDVSFLSTGAITLSGGSSVTLNSNSPVLATTASDSGGNDAVTISGGNSNDLNGVIYAPNGTLDITGGASTTTASGSCLELVASQIALSGGTTTSVSCPGFQGSSGSNTVTLTQ